LKRRLAEDNFYYITTRGSTIFEIGLADKIEYFSYDEIHSAIFVVLAFFRKAGLDRILVDVFEHFDKLCDILDDPAPESVHPHMPPQLVDRVIMNRENRQNPLHDPRQIRVFQGLDQKVDMIVHDREIFQVEVIFFLGFFDYIHKKRFDLVIFEDHFVAVDLGTDMVCGAFF
jgi:hypothetical protein